MERQLERCCGLDVHKETIAACVRLGGRTGKAEQYVQTFGTTVGDLLPHISSRSPGARRT
jgi:transposase